MTIENDFLPFAVGGSANVTPQATYAANTALLQGGAVSGIAKSADANKTWRQSSIMAAVLAQFIVAQTGQPAIDDGTTATLLANLTTAVGQNASRVQGLSAQNNATTPSTQFDISANSVTVRNPSTGTTWFIANTGIITNNISTAGPAANGRDQSAAFTASTFVHFYFIWNGTTLATLSSASAPPTGPTLPSGYTSWAYVGAVYLNASLALAAMHMRGAWATYDLRQLAVSGTSVSLATVSLASLIPPNALNYQLACQQLSITLTSGGIGSVLLGIEVLSGTTDYAYATTLQQAGVASNSVSMNAGTPILPNINQQYFYILVVTSGTGPATTHYVTGYKMPNGGE